MSRLLQLLTLAMALVTFGGAPAWACGFLVAENGAIRLDTFTAAAILDDDGSAHYVTSFSFNGSPESFGAIIPLPDVPTEVERAPDWFLQRLGIETSPRLALEAPAAATAGLEDEAAEVIATYEVDALDITVLEGGGSEVLAWTDANGFDLGVGDGDIEDRSDAVEMLDFYGQRSPYFAALRFDNERAVEQGLNSGDGTPVRFGFEGQDQAWIPVRVLGFDKPGTELVVAELYLMTHGRPTIMGGQVPGTEVVFQQDYQSGDQLIADLTDDDRAGWVPTGFTLTRIDVRTEQRLLDFDVAARVGAVPEAESAYGVTLTGDRPAPLVPQEPTPEAPTPEAPTPEAPTPVAPTSDGPTTDAPTSTRTPVILAALAVLAVAGLGLVLRRRTGHLRDLP
ncbi:MAG TPA: DUF2330 domain-containing protein [Euzebya sp.]|nr:DUF2330 domain-containing protein [Euzebya sp.]